MTPTPAQIDLAKRVPYSVRDIAEAIAAAELRGHTRAVQETAIASIHKGASMNSAHLARELSDFAKHAASAAKGMRALGDANGGHYNDGREAAFAWLAYLLLNPESHLMQKLREEVKP